jgi:hypothetical protein
VAFDAVAVQQPVRGPRVHPAYDHHVAGNRFQEQSARVLRIEVVR